MTIGISGSGKSTWAQKFALIQKNDHQENWVIIERDLIRQSICVEKNIPFSWKHWNWKWEKEVSKIALQEIINAIEEPSVHGFIISDTNLNIKRRQYLIDKIKQYGVDSIELKVFDISFENACVNDQHRCLSVGYSTIARQFEQFNQEFYGHDRYVPDPSLPRCFIFDIDGTLAHHYDQRSPYEYDQCDQDHPDEACTFIFKMMQAYQMYEKLDLIIVSGREDFVFQKTEQWLTEHECYYTHMYLRKTGDFRSDTIIKREIFDQYIRHQYYVMGVFDDRPTVCRMWRNLGLKVFQVANPYIEF